MLRIIKETNINYPEFEIVKHYLFQAFNFLNSGEVKEVIKCCKNGIRICKTIKKKAVAQFDEPIANKCLVVEAYLSLFMAYASFWKSIKLGEFNASWSNLQDSIDSLNLVYNFTDERDSFYLNLLDKHLKKLEELYPYIYFNSVEIVIKEQHCSICKRNSFDPECVHIPGEIYYGEIASNIVTKADLIATSLVEHPADKRCVIIYPDNSESFKIIKAFASQVKFPLQLFELEKTVERVSTSELNSIGRNEKCPCGSGNKYKKCCYLKGYVERPHMNIILNQIVSLKPFIN